MMSTSSPDPAAETRSAHERQRLVAVVACHRVTRVATMPHDTWIRQPLDHVKVPGQHRLIAPSQLDIVLRHLDPFSHAYRLSHEGHRPFTSLL